MRTDVNNVILEPLVEFTHFGSLTQRSRFKVEEITGMYEIYFPWNIFVEPSEKISVDLLFKDTVEIKNGVVDGTGCYVQDGYGCPTFKNLEDAVEFIEYYNDNKNKFTLIDWELANCNAQKLN